MDSYRQAGCSKQDHGGVGDGPEEGADSEEADKSIECAGVYGCEAEGGDLAGEELWGHGVEQDFRTIGLNKILEQLIEANVIIAINLKSVVYKNVTRHSV